MNLNSYNCFDSLTEQLALLFIEGCLFNSHSISWSQK